MKTLTCTVLALALSSFSFASLAAQEVVNVPANQQRIGVVSGSTNSSNLGDLQAQLQAKADAANATSYRIMSAGGSETLSGSAELYR